MQQFTAQFYRQAPKSVALLLCLWLSGAVCVLNCNLPGVAAAENSPSESVADQNLPPCHRAAQSAEETNQNRAFLNDAPFFPLAKCCPLFNAALERAKEFHVVKTAAQPAQIKLPARRLQQREFAFRPNYKPPPVSRGSTYLLNCVFLI